MVKSINVWRTIRSFAVEGLGEVVRVGDTIMVRSEKNNARPYVADVRRIKIDSKNNIMVEMQWYYRPEETNLGIRDFHGAKELFISDHIEEHSAKTIIGKCIVHTFDEYTNLANVGERDFFYRAKYDGTTKRFTPDEIKIYCLCGSPYNPDLLMVQCESCEDWFHPRCIDKTEHEVREMETFICQQCQDQHEARRVRRRRR